MKLTKSLGISGLCKLASVLGFAVILLSFWRRADDVCGRWSCVPEWVSGLVGGQLNERD
jgi:hypothetical protein